MVVGVSVQEVGEFINVVNNPIGSQDSLQHAKGTETNLVDGIQRRKTKPVHLTSDPAMPEAIQLRYGKPCSALVPQGVVQAD